MFFAVEGSGEGLDVKADLFGVFYEAVSVEFRRILDQKIMHLPVFALIRGRQRGLGRYMGEIPVFIRVVLDNKSDLALESLRDFFYGRTGRDTMGSLEINEFYDSDRSVIRTK